MLVALLMPMWCGCSEQDKERAQKHHDELVISINTGKNDLREKKQERGAVADANRKAGYAALPVLQALLLLPNTTAEGLHAAPALAFRHVSNTARSQR